MQEVLDELGGIAGGCERLLSTPIPLSYTRHCTRSLMIWLLTAPFALYHHCGFMMVPMLFFMSFLMLGAPPAPRCPHPIVHTLCVVKLFLKFTLYFLYYAEPKH
jgi:hypothetical protein